MSNGINLIATKNQTILTPFLKKIRVIRFIAVGLLFTVAVSSTILFILIALSPLPALKKQEQATLATLAEFHPDIARLMILNERVNRISTIISKRPDYNTVLNAVKSKLSPETNIISLQLGKKDLSLTISSKSLTGLNSFIDGIMSQTGKDKIFTHATLNDLSLDGTKNEYLLVMDLTTL